MVSLQSQNIFEAKIALLITFLLQPYITFAYVYTGIWQSNVTIQNANLDSSNTSFILTQQIQNCPYQKQYLITPYYLDLLINNNNNNIQFNISMTQQASQVAFSITNEYKISFQIAEICLKNAYVKQIKIVNPVFDSNQQYYFYDEKPTNFIKGMRAYGFITGFTSSKSTDYSLYLEQSSANFTGFNFRFSTRSQSQIKEINFNYIYFSDNQQYKNYYSIQSDYQYGQIDMNQNQYPIYSSVNLDKIRSTTNSRISISFCTKNYVNTLYSISGFNFCSDPQICDGIRAKISFDYKTNYFNYSTWGTSQIKSITSFFLQFQMLNCYLNNNQQQVNYQDQCVDTCPVGQKVIDTTNDSRQICQPCTNQKCLTCNQDSCTSCQSNTPFLFEQNCQEKQPQNTYCSQQIDQYICSKCPTDCPNFCDKDGNCIKCPSGQYYYHQQCFTGNPPPNTYYDQNQKEYYDCHISCLTCSGGSNQECNSCDTTQFTLVSNSMCFCTDQTKGLNTQNGNCQTCQAQGCQDCSLNYKICQTCQIGMKLNNNQACDCEDPSQNFVSELNQCATQYKLINCQQPYSYNLYCNKCLEGYYNIQGICKLCSKGYYATDDNQCIGKCPQYCINCLNSTSCLQYDDSIPCYYACSSCTIPNSKNSCSSCISKTRFFNLKTNSCDCVDGYEESGEVDCKQIPNPISSSLVNSLTNYFEASFYIQMPFIFLPAFAFAQYSFHLQQYIGILSLLQENRGKNLRKQLTGYFNRYNFYSNPQGDQTQLTQSLIECLKQNDYNRSAKINNQISMDQIPKQLDTEMISDILSSSKSSSKPLRMK
ncbi:transmembrane protein, putative (macronuclear) [Tetrahymena thermophila SB210]|uniref:Transmembrane protein, putative n=1 Tax=Tetrahymena thermophila (strain SB210) TaxID=312017 RepID=Q231X8_TETTS|nr:transmembrane protein, putative [Tetrahymena thermophila SB210]EAR91322.2 transmembrane protein, putative [Tetrahymena thermophila SB210]|eukprot:XP_001011567.2 transmembrane protein, putative [Tetrahymena thermophila SB210]